LIPAHKDPTYEQVLLSVNLGCIVVHPNSCYWVI
jgi:hypothetical protein